MTGWLRIALAVLAASLAVVVAVGGVLLAIAHGWLPEARRQIVELALNGVLDGEVHVGSVLGPPDDLTLEAVRWAPEHGIPTSVERVQVRAAWEDLIGAPRRIRLLALAGLRLEAERDEAGRWQVGGLALSPSGPDAEAEIAADDASTPPTLEIETVELSDLQLEVRWSEGARRDVVAAQGRLELADVRWPVSRASLPSRIQGELTLAPSRAGPVAVRSGHVRGAFERDRIEISAADLDLTTREGLPLTTLTLEGHARLATQPGVALASAEASFGFDGLDLAAATGDLRLRSDLDGRAHAGLAERGADDPVALDLRAEVDPTRIGPYDLERIRGAGRLTAGEDGWQSPRWQVHDAEVAGSFGRAALAGRGGREIETLDVTVRDLDLAVLPRTWLRATSLEGRADLHAELTGAFLDPRGPVELSLASLRIDERAPFDADLDLVLQGGGRFRLDALEASGVRPPRLSLRSVAPAAFHVHAGGVAVEGLHLEGSAGTLRVSGALEDGRWRGVRAKLDALDLRTIDALGWLDVTVAGVVSASLELDGALRQPRGSATLEWSAPRVGELHADGLWLDLAAPDGAATQLHAELGLQGRRPLEVAATLPPAVELGAARTLSDWLGPDTDVRLTLRELGPAELRGLMRDPDESLATLGGQASGSLQLRGPLGDPILRGRLQWTEPRLGPATADLVDLELQTESGELRASLDLSEGSRKLLRARALVPLAALLRDPASVLGNRDSELELRVRELELAWLLVRAQLENEAIRGVEGTVDGLLEARGSADGPVLRGRLSLADVRIRSRLFETPIGPIHGDLTFDGSRVRVDSLVAESEEGTARLSGSFGVGLDGVSDVALETHFDGFRLTQVPFLETRLEGSVALHGAIDALHASGAVELEAARFEIPDKRDPILKEIRILGAPTDERLTTLATTRRAPTGVYGSATADVAIEVTPGARLRGQGLDLELLGGLQLSKRTGEGAELLGSLRSTGGRYRLRGRKLRVERGLATFTQGRLMDPLLDVLAVYDVSRVRIEVELTGRASDLQPRLSSTPPMDDTEIVSYLIFGKPTSELGQGDSSQLQGAVAGVVGGVVLDEFGDELAKTIWVDRITIGVDEEATLPTIGVEKEITDDILVRYDKSFRTTGGDRFEVEYRFWRRFSLESEVTSSGASGANLIWSLDY